MVRRSIEHDQHRKNSMLTATIGKLMHQVSVGITVDCAITLQFFARELVQIKPFQTERTYSSLSCSSLTKI